LEWIRRQGRGGRFWKLHAATPALFEHLLRGFQPISIIKRAEALFFDNPHHVAVRAGLPVSANNVKMVAMAPGVCGQGTILAGDIPDSRSFPV
jgi:hypothetical protein